MNAFLHAPPAAPSPVGPPPGIENSVFIQIWFTIKLDSQFWGTAITYQELNYSRIITVIPVYNGQAFIGQTLASVAQQTLKPGRVIVIDDGSTDATPEIVRGFKELACEYIRNPTNLGLVKNYNRALDFAKETDYLQILHADDLIDPIFTGS